MRWKFGGDVHRVNAGPVRGEALPRADGMQVGAVASAAHRITMSRQNEKGAGEVPAPSSTRCRKRSAAAVTAVLLAAGHRADAGGLAADAGAVVVGQHVRDALGHALAHRN